MILRLYSRICSVSALMLAKAGPIEVRRAGLRSILTSDLMIRLLDPCRRSPLVSRCTQIPELRLFVFNPFLGFECIVTALNSRIVAHKTRTKFLLKFVRDISTKMTLSSFCASFSSTNSSVDSGI
jgi:hypothetical protein